MNCDKCGIPKGIFSGSCDERRCPLLFSLLSDPTPSLTDVFPDGAAAPCTFHTPTQFMVSISVDIRTNKGAGFVSESYAGSVDGLDGLAALIRIWRDLCDTVKPEVIE